MKFTKAMAFDRPQRILYGSISGLATRLRQHVRNLAGDDIRTFGRHTFLNLAMIAVVTAVIYVVDGYADLRHEIMLYFAPVLVAMLRWSVTQGIIAAIVSALVAAFFFYEPIYSFYLDDPRHAIGLVLFVVTVGIIGYLVTNLRRARSTSGSSSTQGRSDVKTDVAVAASSQGTLSERIRDFLIQSPEGMYCDRCIQENLGVRWREQVQVITATLAVTQGFDRAPAECCGCKELKQTTRTIGIL